MAPVPRVLSATVNGPAQLLVVFNDGSKRIYDCGQLLNRAEFEPLKNVAFFRQVRVDAGGYGVSWNDRIDLSEYELWTNGRPVSQQALAGLIPDA